MLSKKDLNEIRKIVQEELKEALTIGIKYEKFDKNTGIKEAITKEFHLPVWLADQFPYLTGALRGMQTDTNKANNRMIKTAENVEILSNIMLQTESSLKAISAVSDKIKKIPSDEAIQIES